jgi:YfiH family protein
VSGPAPIVLDLPGGRVAFSTRLGGVSDGPYESLNLGILTGDHRGRVLRNRSLLAGTIGLEAPRIAMGWQVHGADVRHWPGPPEREARAYFPPPDGQPSANEAASSGSAGDGARIRALPRVDGHVTDATRVGLIVLVADCLPVALCSPPRVAILHCGWRGLAAGIVERALARFDEPPAAAIGPGIGRCCYEVGDEVLGAFRDLDGVARGRMLDLRAIVRRKLAAGGVERVEDVDHCTSCRADLYFSHRRDGGVTGRQGGLIWREP